MTRLERLIAHLWNRRFRRVPAPASDRRALDLGPQVIDGEPSQNRVRIAHDRRAQHIAILGRTGTGKSSLLHYLAQQDIYSGRGFLYFDLHGDTTEFLVKAIAARERALKKDLSSRLIVIDPADPDCSVGLNPLEHESRNDRYSQIAEFAQILKQRWHLDSLGARTDELLRNSLYVLAENGLTLTELGLFLGNATFRSRLLTNVSDAEVKQYFELRYEPASDAMRAVMAEPILNKTSAFIADPRFRHIVGQSRSTFSLADALDGNRWIVVNLEKGRLGEQSATIGSLLLARVKHTLFGRKSRTLFTLYCDEIQNLLTFGGDLETTLSEARKFAVGVVSANQYLEQYSPEMRAAILAVGTHILFQLSGPDAQQMAAILDGGRPLAELLKNLPRRHLVVKSCHERWREAVMPVVREPDVDASDLYRRSRARWARSRSEIEKEIRDRQAIVGRSQTEVLHGWE